MDAVVARFSSTPRSAKLSLVGLAIGVLGLVVQWIGDPAKFGGFPPGIAFIAVAGLLAFVASGRWWAPVFSVLIALWIDFGGLAAGKMIPNFRSSNAGTVVGTAVMALGLLFAVYTGVVAMLTARRTRTSATAR